MSHAGLKILQYLPDIVAMLAFIYDGTSTFILFELFYAMPRAFIALL